MENIKKIISWCKNIFFPGTCALCECFLTGITEIRYGLCDKCRISIIPINGDKCKKCGKPLVSEIQTCLSCRNKENSYLDRLYVLFPYKGRYRKLLSSYKFSKNQVLAEILAEKVTELISNESVFKNVPIIPVPPRPGKIKNTGWDQVECLVKKLGKKKDLNVKRILKRRKSLIQKYLSRTERMENLKGRIYLNGKIPKAAFVIDDVITTGSTMEVCACVLKESGVQEVYGLCLFYD
jgi:ComF family protein